MGMGQSDEASKLQTQGRFLERANSTRGSKWIAKGETRGLESDHVTHTRVNAMMTEVSPKATPNSREVEYIRSIGYKQHAISRTYKTHRINNNLFHHVKSK